MLDTLAEWEIAPFNSLVSSIVLLNTLRSGDDSVVLSSAVMTCSIYVDDDVNDEVEMM